MPSNRTRLSLAQFLELQDQGLAALLLDKHGIGGMEVHYTTEVLQELVSAIQPAEDGSLGSLIRELTQTHDNLRNRVSPRYRYDERLSDLKACLLLDGYLLSDRELMPLDPSIAEEGVFGVL